MTAVLHLQINDARKLIIEAGIALATKKLILGSWGNISMKIEKDCFAITPSGRSYDQLKPDDIIIVNSEGVKMAGVRTPSTEIKMHLALYKANPEFNAVIHTHSIYACAVASMRRDIPPFIEDMVQVVGGPIRCSDYALAGTEELAKNAVIAVGDNNAALLANHGAVCCGKNMREALNIASIVEKSAQIFCITEPMGGAVNIDAKNTKNLRAFYKEHYSKRQAGEEL
jgi:L-fuculose-phosphate aldolase